MRCSFALHPAASRVKLLSQQIPASIVFFDLLCEGDRDLAGRTVRNRRRELEALLRPPRRRSISRRRLATRARGGLVSPLRRRRLRRRHGEAGFRGPTSPNKRVMLKVKHERDCDCVVAGFRWHKKGERQAVGSLLLGLFDDSGVLQHVGVCASFTAGETPRTCGISRALSQECARESPWKAWAEHAMPSGEAGQRMPGGQSRWSQGKDLSWEPLRPELVVEVAYDHMQGDRFRHMAQFRRWRHR